MGGELGRLVGLELAGGQLPDVAAGRMSKLMQQTDAVSIIYGDDGGAARVMQDLEIGAVPIWQVNRVDGEMSDFSAEDLALRDEGRHPRERS